MPRLQQYMKSKTKINIHFIIEIGKKKSFTKICLTVNSEEELLKVYNECKLNAIPTVLITDNGRTEFNDIPTNTCIGIGPFWNCEINKVTSHLKLY